MVAVRVAVAAVVE